MSTASTLPAYSGCEAGAKQYLKVCEQANASHADDSEYLQEVAEIPFRSTVPDAADSINRDSLDSFDGEYTDFPQSMVPMDPPANSNHQHNHDSAEFTPRVGESCFDEHPYTREYFASSLPDVTGSKSTLNNGNPRERYSSSSSGIFEDIDDWGYSTKGNITNFLSSCVPQLDIANETSGDKVQGECRPYEMDDMENVSLVEETGQEEYIDIEKVELLPPTNL